MDGGAKKYRLVMEVCGVGGLTGNRPTTSSRISFQLTLMRIAFTTDTHLVIGYQGMTTEKQLLAMRDDIYAENPDVIAHGGDIGEVRVDARNITEVLRVLGENKKIDCVGVVGNHDLWTNPGLVTSATLWHEVLPRMFSDNGWHYLEQSNWIKDGVAIVGSYLHYDYSSADPEGAAVNHIRASFPDWTPDEYYERMKKRVVNDARFFIGLPSDKVFAKMIGDAFVKRLLEAQESDSVHSIILITHVPCMPCQITRKPFEWHWSCSTAYFGNLSHVETITKCSKIKFILSGHSHQPNHTLMELNNEQVIDITTLGSDYGKPLFKMIEV